MQQSINEIKKKVLKYSNQLKHNALTELDEAKDVFNNVMDLLEIGAIKIVEKKNNHWIMNCWIKDAILLGMELGKNTSILIENRYAFVDKDTFPLQKIMEDRQIRVLTPSAGIRRGAYVGKHCVLMPPAYINVGAYIGEGTIIESLAGSCCSIGKNCHISTNATIGGVLSPKESFPVILGDNVLLGEGSGITQGVRVGDNVAIAPGVHISKSTVVIDTVNEQAYCFDGVYKIDNVSNVAIKVYKKGKLIKEKNPNFGPNIPDNALVINGLILSENGNLKITPTIIKYSEKGANFFSDTNILKINN